MPDRRGDLPRREHAGGDLVEQRLEEVVVAAVDQRDVHRHVGESPDGQEAAEAPADDDHLVPRGLLGHGHVYSPGLECMIPPSAKTVVAVM